MSARNELRYLFTRGFILLVLVVVLMLVFGDLASGSGNQTTIARRTARKSIAVLHEGSLFLPLVYGGAAPVPSPSPTPIPIPTPAPTPTATPIPGELWTWVARAGNVGETTEIIAVIPGYCCELIGMKSGKTIYVQAVCPAEPTCEIFPAPPEIPPPFAWGDVEKLIYDANCQQVCSIQWPFNCVGVR